jgi:hypothetical protein
MQEDETELKENGNLGAVQVEGGTNNAFVQHLKHASSVLKTWPAWKQEILGAVFTQANTEDETADGACEMSPAAPD